MQVIHCPAVMPVDTKAVGKSFPPAVYAVGREKVREYAHAVGETLDERERGSTIDVVRRQISAAFEGVGLAELERCVVAYEPVWAIGTGHTATPEQAQEVCHVIRTLLDELDPAADGERQRILYGGSVTGENAAALFGEHDIDGGLVGGASLNPAEFFAIVVAAARSGAIT